MRYCFGIIYSLLIVVALSGCMGQELEASQSHIAYQSQLDEVQSAVLDYKKDTGVLPILNSSEHTPIYEKYRIDFKRLVPEYMSEPPSNAYSKGGYFEYVLIHPEKNPQVKVFDLTLVNKVQEIEQQIQDYRYNKGYSPLGGVITEKRYKIDFKDLGYTKPPTVTSPYSGKPLGFIMDNHSHVYINYLPDIKRAYKKYKNDVHEGEDLRELLAKHSLYVPVKSLPYTVKNNRIVFLVK
ncbi:hypothetical protein JOD45_001514 [Scopulibacillus daqui]|uniref:Lipoprotein n=1 Tax=Scopulibacillus daqui TaxID=1469162 RepID=A0ABS2PZ23_9BACL|nr:hypothetical protein [Scopulibacillus daqui]MBM7645303.1 hypothetical protein [Scopulibacillus daqui]